MCNIFVISMMVIVGSAMVSSDVVNHQDFINKLPLKLQKAMKPLSVKPSKMMDGYFMGLMATNEKGITMAQLTFLIDNEIFYFCHITFELHKIEQTQEPSGPHQYDPVQVPLYGRIETYLNGATSFTEEDAKAIRELKLEPSETLLGSETSVKAAIKILQPLLDDMDKSWQDGFEGEAGIVYSPATYIYKGVEVGQCAVVFKGKYSKVAWLATALANATRNSLSRLYGSLTSFVSDKCGAIAATASGAAKGAKEGYNNHKKSIEERQT